MHYQVEKLKHAALIFLLFAIGAPTANLFADDPPEARQLHNTAANLFEQGRKSNNMADFELSAEQWKQLLTKYPDYSQRQDAQYWLGLTYYHLKKFDDAAEQLGSLKNSLDDLKDYRRSERLLFFLAYCEFSAGKQDQDSGTKKLNQALANFATFFKTFPDSTLSDQAMFFQGETHYQLHVMGDDEQLESAISTYQRLVDSYPDSGFRSNAMYALGVGYEESGDYAKANQVYKSFLDAYSDNGNAGEVRLRLADTEMQLAIARANAGDEQTATERFQVAEKMFADAAKDRNVAGADHALFHQAYCLLRLKQTKKAADVYATLANEFQDSEFAAESILSAGKYYFSAKQFETATKWLELALEENETNQLDAAHWLCRIDIDQKRFDKALQRAKKFVDSGGRENPFRVYLMMDAADALYEQSDQRADSVDYYQMIADEYPDHELAPKALYYGAFACLETNQTATAVKLAEQFRNNYPNDSFYPDTMEVFGEALLKENQYSGAETVFAGLIDRHRAHEKLDWWHTRVGWTRYLQEDYDEAIRGLESAVSDMEGAKDRSEASYVIGASHFKLKKFDDAISAFEDSLDADANRVNANEVRLLVARSNFELGHADRAITAAKTIMNNNPQSAMADQASYWLGEFNFADGDFGQAVRHYTAVIENANEKSELLPDSYYGKAWALLKDEKHELAEVEFDHLMSKYPNHPRVQDALIGRGMTRRMSGKFNDAIEDFDKFLAGDPSESNQFNAMYERGLAYVGIEDWTNAIRSFKPLVTQTSLNPDLADDIQYELAWANKKNGDEQQAAKHFQTIVDDYSDSSFAAESHYHLAQSLYDGEDYVTAAKHYQICLDTVKDHQIAERAAYKLGWSHFRNKEFEKAHGAFEQQVNKHPNGRFSADGMFMVSESLFRDDKHQLAVTAYKKAIPIVNSSPEVKDNVKMLAAIHGAQSANKVKDYASALDFAQKLVETNSDADYVAEAYYEIGVAQKGLGDREEAVNAWTNAMNKSLGKTGARARCMVAEDLFEQKKFDEAIKQFKLVIYGYGGLQSADDIKPWQAFAAYEAARCNHVQIEQETNAQRRQSLIDQAKDLFKYVVENHPENNLASSAKKQLAALQQLR